MKEIQFLDEQKAVWYALSDLYLDTELQESDFRDIVLVFSKSPFTFNEIKEINRDEVFPVLFSNLLNAAGEWAGFNEKILVKNIMSWMESRTGLDLFAVKCIYPIYEWINESYWEKIEKIYNQIADRHHR